MASHTKNGAVRCSAEQAFIFSGHCFISSNLHWYAHNRIINRIPLFVFFKPTYCTSMHGLRDKHKTYLHSGKRVYMHSDQINYRRNPPVFMMYFYSDQAFNPLTWVHVNVATDCHVPWLCGCKMTPNYHSVHIMVNGWNTQLGYHQRRRYVHTLWWLQQFRFFL